MTTAARTFWRALLLGLHLLLALVLTPLATHRDPALGWQRDARISTWWLRRLSRILGLRVRIHGEAPRAPALVVANHVSWMDIVVLGQLLPTAFLSKAEIARWPLVGWLARRAGTLFIQRGQGQAGGIAEQIGQRLRLGGMLTLFPEGTTSDGRAVLPFFPRLFAAAIETGVPVSPVALRYTVDGQYDAIAPFIDEQTLLGNLLGWLGRPASQVEVDFRPPIASAGAERKALAEQARAAIARVVESSV
jgi:1-acyl-sn-glycerol-3-phosphate acyltransferase